MEVNRTSSTRILGQSRGLIGKDTTTLTLASSLQVVEPNDWELFFGLLLAALGAAALVIIADVMTPKKQLASVLGIYVGVSFGLVAALGLSQLIDVVAEAWQLDEAGASLFCRASPSILCTAGQSTAPSTRICATSC